MNCFGNSIRFATIKMRCLKQTTHFRRNICFLGNRTLLAARGVPAAAIPSLVAATQQAYNNAGFVPGGRDGISEVTGDNWRVGFTLGAIFEHWNSK